jgi:uncharacterized protein YjbJ (UPF0337 family)
MGDDKAEGNVDQAKGKGKQAWGEATDDESKKAEGQADEGKGKAKEAWSDVKDKAGDLKDKATD